MQPVELMTDTAGYSDQVFGLFRLLGYQFSPRLADIGSARFWRITRDADYGQLSGLARHQINTDLIATHWDDLLRVAGSLATGTVRASELLRVLQGGGRPTPLGRPVAELGRITKTLYLLAYLDDETYRRRILTQLNRTESRHALARAVFHGQRGQLRRSAPSASSSTPSSCGTLATKTPPSTTCAATVTTSAATTYDGPWYGCSRRSVGPAAAGHPRSGRARRLRGRQAG